MKKLTALLLALVLSLGMVPASLAADTQADTAAPKVETGKPIKVLSIGNSYSQDAFEYLYKVLTAEGYTDVVLGYLYVGGCDLAQHQQYAHENAGVYTYYKNNSNYWQREDKQTMQRGLTDENWDVISLQTSPPYSGVTSTFADPFAYLIPYINKLKTNPDAKLGWHMTWSYQQSYKSSDFSEIYNSDAKYMYQCITVATQQGILTNKNFDFVVPSGTAVENAKSSYYGDNLHRDGVHMNELGKLIAAYTWYSVLSGNTVDAIKFSTINGYEMTATDCALVAEAVRNAIADPYRMTASSYSVRPVTYTVNVDNRTSQWAEGDTVTITAAAAGSRPFDRWKVISGDVTLADPKSSTTTFTMPGHDVELSSSYVIVGDDAPVVGDFKVGIGQGDITPSQSAPLAGFGVTTERMSLGTRQSVDRLMATAVAVSGGGQTNILVTIDTIRTPSQWTDKIGPRIEAELGIPADQVSISATHTHSGPDIGDQESATQAAKALTSESWYYKEWEDGIIKACADAIADLSGTSKTMYAVEKVEGMNWIRHWRTSLGTMNGVNTTTSGITYKGHPRETDQNLQVIRFFRPGEKKDIVLVNWGAHANKVPASEVMMDGTSARRFMTADYPGYMRRYVETEDGDCQVAFFGAAGGNVLGTTNQSSVKRLWQPPDRVEDYGEKLGTYVMKAMENMTTIETGEVKSLRIQHEAFNRGYGSIRQIEQDVIVIGDKIAFATAGYEMFDVNGMDVKKGSPYELTFILTNTQGHEYMPSWETCHYPVLNNSPEAYEARKDQFNEVPGTAEDLVDSLVAMLNKLYKS